MNRRALTTAVGLAMVAALATACGGDPDAAATTEAAAEQPAATSAAAATPGEHDTMAAPTIDTPASELRAGLTALLQEHVYLAGIAISTAVQAGGDLEAPAPASAVATLDANSVALSDAIASVYGDAAGEQFLELWRNHIGFFVEYTLGGATGDQAMQDAARASLDAYREDFGAFIESATGGNLAAATVADNLQVHVDTLIVAVDAILAGSPEVFPQLREAASHMPGTAAALSGAIVSQFPDQFAS